MAEPRACDRLLGLVEFRKSLRDAGSNRGDCRMSNSFAKFEIRCDEIGFSRMHMVPIDARGYVHQLAEDLERALEFYALRVENHKLKQAALGYGYTTAPEAAGKDGK